MIIFINRLQNYKKSCTYAKKSVILHRKSAESTLDYFNHDKKI